MLIYIIKHSVVAFIQSPGNIQIPSLRGVGSYRPALTIYSCNTNTWLLLN